MKRFHLFTWYGYDSGGLINDYLGSFDTLDEAISQDGMLEVSCVIEVRNNELWIVAEHDGWPPEWETKEEKLNK